MANVFAQAEALAFGNTTDEVERKARQTGLCRIGFRWQPALKHDPADRLTPTPLGKLVALYEHSVFTQG